MIRYNNDMINLFSFSIKTVVHIVIKYDQLKPINPF